MKIGATIGAQSVAYMKNEGAYALNVSLANIVNDCAGYTNADALTLTKAIVALPLTSFSPASRNIISKECINSYDRAARVPETSTITNDLKTPGITVTLILKAFELVGEKESTEYVPTSKNISFTPARHKNSGPAVMLGLLEF
jgi:hypothetical protein